MKLRQAVVQMKSLLVVKHKTNKSIKTEKKAGVVPYEHNPAFFLSIPVFLSPYVLFLTYFVWQYSLTPKQIFQAICF